MLISAAVSHGRVTAEQEGREGLQHKCGLLVHQGVSSVLYRAHSCLQVECTSKIVPQLDVAAKRH